VTTLDTYSHFGRSHHIHWLGPHTLFYAAIARIAGIPGTDLPRLVGLLSWVLPVLGALAAALTVVLAASLSGEVGVAVMAGLAFALSGDALVCFHHGEIDHHPFAS